MLLLNHVTENGTSARVEPSKDSKYFLAVCGTFGTATVTVNRYIKDAEGEDVLIESDPNLVFTQPSELIEIGFPRGTSLEVAVADADGTTDVTAFLGD